MTPTMLLPWQHSRLQSLSVKNQISPFAIFKSGTEDLARHKNDSHKNEHAADTLSSEMFHTKTLLSTEADGNSEMAHFLTLK